MYTYYKNSQLVINFTIKNVETQAFHDPATISITVKIYNPDGEVLETTIYTYPASAALIKTSTGNYKLFHTPANYGKMVYGITTTTPAAFYVGAIVVKDNTI
jgi:hypothetical protein